MSTAIVDGLKAVGGRRLAVATAYNETVTECLRVFLEESGFEILVAQGLGLSEKIGGSGSKMSQREDLERFAVSVFQQALPEADALLVSCGGVPDTWTVIEPLEKQCKVPVVSSMPHAIWAGAPFAGRFVHGIRLRNAACPCQDSARSTGTEASAHLPEWAMVIDSPLGQPYIIACQRVSPFVLAKIKTLEEPCALRF